MYFKLQKTKYKKTKIQKKTKYKKKQKYKKKTKIQKNKNTKYIYNRVSQYQEFMPVYSHNKEQKNLR
jgi:hypothetical protein